MYNKKFTVEYSRQKNIEQESRIQDLINSRATYCDTLLAVIH